MNASNDWDVIVVGAGITGLALGLVLHQGGLKVKVLDRRPVPNFVPQTAYDTRIYAMSRPSVDFLTRAGGWQEMDQGRVQCLSAMEVRGDRGGHLSLIPKTPLPPMGWVVEAGAMLGGLRAHQQRVAPDLVEEQPASCDEVQAAPQSLRVRARGRSYTTRLLLACDGVTSTLREKMGMAAHFTPYGQTALVANYRIEGAHQGVAWQWFVAGEVVALLPLPGAHVSLVWSARTDHAMALMRMTPAERTQALQEQVGYGFGRLEEISSPAAFELRRMTVSRWVSPCFALVGDAAHGVHPLAGQGLNLGLEDAACLADILLRRLPGPPLGDLSLLRRYERARREPVAAMQLLTGGLVALFSRSMGPLGTLRNQGMNQINAWAGVKQALIHQANR